MQEAWTLLLVTDPFWNEGCLVISLTFFFFCDPKGAADGTHAYYTRWQGNEIVFHVATLIPYDKHQQVHLPSSLAYVEINPVP